MKANELRIGNYVMLINKPDNSNIDVSKIPLIVSGIRVFFGSDYEDIIRCEYKPDADSRSVFEYGISKFKPIQLTEELLLKCGFKIIMSNDLVVVYQNKVFAELIKVVYVLKAGCFMFNGREIYLHDIQNIYYALTGEELEVKF